MRADSCCLSTPQNLGELASFIAHSDIRADTRNRMLAAITRLSDLTGSRPEFIGTDIAALRSKIASIPMTRSRVRPRELKGLRNSLTLALHHAGVVDARVDGAIWRHHSWRRAMRALAPHTYLFQTIRPFANWCASRNFDPGGVRDSVLAQFIDWRARNTLHADDVCTERYVAMAWNRAAGEVATHWPQQKLTLRQPGRIRPRTDKNMFTKEFRRDVERYLRLRASPESFEIDKDAPGTPLASSSIITHRANTHRAAAILIEHGREARTITSLADLVEPEAMKTVLRYVHEKAGRNPSKYLKSMSSILLQAARFYVRPPQHRLQILKEIASCVPHPSKRMTERSATVLRRLEDNGARRRLLQLPNTIMSDIAADLERGRVRNVDAQMAIAIDILLIAPLSSTKLVGLNWARNFRRGADHKDQVHIELEKRGARCRKGLLYVVPRDVLDRLEWYRHYILPRLGAPKDGDLFVTKEGRVKSPITFSMQLRQFTEAHMGVNITSRDFRHFAANLHLEARPDDIESLRSFLGYVGPKSEEIYKDLRRHLAARRYSQFVIGECERALDQAQS